MQNDVCSSLLLILGAGFQPRSASSPNNLSIVLALVFLALVFLVPVVFGFVDRSYCLPVVCSLVGIAAFGLCLSEFIYTRTNITIRVNPLHFFFFLGGKIQHHNSQLPFILLTSLLLRLLHSVHYNTTPQQRPTYKHPNTPLLQSYIEGI